MMLPSRRISVHTVHGFWVSILPHRRQISIFSSAVCIAAASGAMICSRFLMRKSAARRAERGPSPGRRESSWIRRSISGPAVVATMDQRSKQFHSRRQRQAAGNILHFLLQQCFGLSPRIGVCGNDEVFHNFLFLRLHEGWIYLNALHLALAGKPDSDDPSARHALDFNHVELSLHGFHLGLELSRLLHQAEEICHVTSLAKHPSSIVATRNRNARRLVVNGGFIGSRLQCFFAGIPPHGLLGDDSGAFANGYDFS